MMPWLSDYVSSVLIVYMNLISILGLYLILSELMCVYMFLMVSDLLLTLLIMNHDEVQIYY